VRLSIGFKKKIQNNFKFLPLYVSFLWKNKGSWENRRKDNSLPLPE
jgi:hypothetical protein